MGTHQSRLPGTRSYRPCFLSIKVCGLIALYSRAYTYFPLLHSTCSTTKKPQGFRSERPTFQGSPAGKAIGFITLASAAAGRTGNENELSAALCCSWPCGCCCGVWACAWDSLGLLLDGACVSAVCAPSKGRLVSGRGPTIIADELLGIAAAFACRAARPNTGACGPAATAEPFQWEQT